MSGISLVLSDLDGTLLTPEHAVTPAAAAAIAGLQRQGCRFSIASARPPRAILPLVRQLGIENVPVAAFNGGTLVNPDGSYWQQHFIPAAAVAEALAWLHSSGASVWLFADNKWLARDAGAAYFATERHTLGYDATLVPGFEPYLARVDKIVATSADFALLERLEAQLQPVLAGQALAARSQAYYLDITALAANKGAALASLAGYCQVPLAATAVFGDGLNDIPMFRQAGLAIAMGQASAAVHQAADAVTTSNRDEGFANGVSRFVAPRLARTI